jgi:collagenase-like PrtC family protease
MRRKAMHSYRIYYENIFDHSSDEDVEVENKDKVSHDQFLHDCQKAYNHIRENSYICSAYDVAQYLVDNLDYTFPDDYEVSIGLYELEAKYYE